MAERRLPSILRCSPTFLPPIPNLILFCQIKLILSQESSFLGEGTPPNRYTSTAEGKTSHESTYKGRGSKEPISSLRKTHTGTDLSPARPQRCRSTRQHSTSLSQLHTHSKFLPRTELTFCFFLRFVASRNEMRHSNPFPQRLKPNLKLEEKQ